MSPFEDIGDLTGCLYSGVRPSPPGDSQNSMSAESLLIKFTKLAGSKIDLTHSQGIIEKIRLKECSLCFIYVAEIVS